MDRYGRQFGPGISGLVLAALAVRALIPVGYMPGSVLDGEYMELCPIASAGAIAILQSMRPDQHRGPAHAHHDAEDPRSSSADQTCPIGSALFVHVIADVPTSVSLDITSLPFAADLPRAVQSRERNHRYHSRAPPLT